MASFDDRDTSFGTQTVTLSAATIAAHAAGTSAAFNNLYNTAGTWDQYMARMGTVLGTELAAVDLDILPATFAAGRLEELQHSATVGALGLPRESSTVPGEFDSGQLALLNCATLQAGSDVQLTQVTIMASVQCYVFLWAVGATANPFAAEKVGRDYTGHTHRLAAAAGRSVHDVSIPVDYLIGEMKHGLGIGISSTYDVFTPIEADTVQVLVSTNVYSSVDLSGATGSYELGFDFAPL